MCSSFDRRRQNHVLAHRSELRHVLFEPIYSFDARKIGPKPANRSQKNAQIKFMAVLRIVNTAATH